ncbi:MAG: hypothetical protein JWN99_2153 [Ilumatobacteraceae bacterium]|nr:hypothetical protein [Ilumatobacteraceae bacterium]
MARWQFRPPIERVKNGFRINLDAGERDLVLRLLDEMRTLLMGPSDNPALTRVFPAAYHQPAHAELDAEYQRLMREELVASRLAGIGMIDEALSSKVPLTEAQLSALMQGLNGLRLILGTVLDVTEDHDVDLIDDDDPQVGEHHLYVFLSWLLEWTVRAMQET